MNARNTMKFKLDQQHPAPLTAKQRKRLQSIAAMPDSDIDYSDAAQSSNTDHSYRPGMLISEESKQQVTLRLDTDVLRFFRGIGKRYQSRINAVLRGRMNAQRKTV